MKIPFVKMSGAGNDFVVVDRMTETAGPEWASIIPAMCHRRFGIGADGVILITPEPTADFTMEYFNADGSSGSMCGNGGRCVAAYMMDRLNRPTVSFQAAGRLYRAERSTNGVKLQMDDPGTVRLHIRLSIGDADILGHFIDTGSPHLVILGHKFGNDARSVVEVGRELRHHADFQPSGTNVDFITATGRDEVTIRTYERGVEDETWACGTGAVAAALIYSLLEGREGPGSVRVTPLSGKTLRVTFRRSGSAFNDIALDGPTVETFAGVYEVGTDHG